MLVRLLGQRSVSNCIASSSLAPGAGHQILLQIGAAEVQDKSKGGGKKSLLTFCLIRCFVCTRLELSMSKCRWRREGPGIEASDWITSSPSFKSIMQCNAHRGWRRLQAQGRNEDATIVVARSTIVYSVVAACVRQQASKPCSCQSKPSSG